MIDYQIQSPLWGNIGLDWAQLTAQSWQAVVQHAPIKLDWAQAQASLLLADNTTMQRLNAQYRGQDKPTNVLSFPQYDAHTDWAGLPKNLPILLGDIVLAAPYVPDEAQADAKNLAHHSTHLLVHGLLHLLGYDHENDTDAETMIALEVACLAQLNINNPYEV
jgi:probable rRNA maturation factor